MVDLLLVVPDTPDQEWNTDIDVIDGVALELTDDDAILAQRATVAGYMTTGTMPLMEEFGVPWDLYVTQQRTIFQMDGVVRQNVADYVGSNGMFIPEFGTSNGQMTVKMTQVKLANEVQ